MLQLLQEGRFLDDSSNVLQGRFVTYNADLESFATAELELTRGSSGAFVGKVTEAFRLSELCSSNMHTQFRSSVRIRLPGLGALKISY